MTFNKDTASILRKYITEWVIIVLAGAVAYLFGLYMDLNKYVRDESAKDRAELIKVVTENTNALNNFYNNQKK